jgi:hypothetical protein
VHAEAAMPVKMVSPGAGGIVHRPIPFAHVKKLELQKPQD